MKSMEDRIENKMKKFEKLMKNAATTSSCNVMSAHRTIQPPYDGQTPWSSYKKQFEAPATANFWEEEQKDTALVISLRGVALQILQTLSDEDISKFNSALTTALELRFRDEHLQEVFGTRLKVRTQKVGESSILRSTTDYSRKACDKKLRK